SRVASAGECNLFASERGSDPRGLESDIRFAWTRKSNRSNPSGGLVDFDIGRHRELRRPGPAGGFVSRDLGPSAGRGVGFSFDFAVRSRSSRRYKEQRGDSVDARGRVWIQDLWVAGDAGRNRGRKDR